MKSSMRIEFLTVLLIFAALFSIAVSIVLQNFYVGLILEIVVFGGVFLISRRMRRRLANSEDLVEPEVRA
jgi:hypothetical protein